MARRATRVRLAAVTVCVAAALAGGCARGRPEAPSRPSLASLQQLRAEVLAATRAPGLERGTWGVTVKSLATGETLLDLNGGALLVPASAAKLVTLAVAAEAVGWDYAFPTRLAAAGTLADGVLDGDLVVTGGGDPTIGEPERDDFGQWADALLARGVTRITGRVIGDDDQVEEPLPPFAWAWDDLGYPYGALPGALNFGRNTAEVTVTPGDAPGLPAALTLAPALRELPITAAITTTAPGAPAALRPILQPGGLGLRVIGSVPADGPALTFGVAVGNPTLWFATMLHQRLREEGIAVAGAPLDLDNVVDRPDLAGSTPLLEHHSPPLAEIAGEMMRDSLNLHGEAVLWLATGPDGPRTTGAALEALRARLAAWGVAPEDHQLVDGSGLSRRSVVSARALVAVLDRLYDPSGASPWMQALPVAGRNGTLEGRLRNTAAESNLRAKTGSMSNIRSLAGYVRTRGGEPLAFAVLVNNFEGPGAAAVEAIDRIAVALADLGR